MAMRLEACVGENVRPTTVTLRVTSLFTCTGQQHVYQGPRRQHKGYNKGSQEKEEAEEASKSTSLTHIGEGEQGQLHGVHVLLCGRCTTQVSIQGKWETGCVCRRGEGGEGTQGTACTVVHMEGW